VNSGKLKPIAAEVRPMSVESKIKFRILVFIAAAIILLAWIVGIVYAFSIALLAFILWKAYSYIKMMRWWKGESAVSRQMIEYVTERLNEGKQSKNVWVQSLTVPEVSKFALDYRVELMARPMMIEKESPNAIEAGLNGAEQGYRIVFFNTPSRNWPRTWEATNIHCRC
jgi:hypothetical protein